MKLWNDVVNWYLFREVSQTHLRQPSGSFYGNLNYFHYLLSQNKNLENVFMFYSLEKKYFEMKHWKQKIETILLWNVETK